jgi:hypothetical protein
MFLPGVSLRTDDSDVSTKGGELAGWRALRFGELAGLFPVGAIDVVYDVGESHIFWIG